jgi:hypothetical protein
MRRMWLLAAAFASLAGSCECTPTHPAERIHAADLVFTARVLHSTGASVEYGIVKSYKGKPPTRLKVFDLAHACNGPRPIADREYLVIARKSAGLWVSGPCEGAFAIDTAGAYLSYLRNADLKRPAANLVTGQLLFPSRVRASALVRLKHGSTIHYATADEAGLFAVENVPEGEYKVEAVAPGFHAAKQPVIRVAGKGVTRAYIPMESERARRR